MDIDWQKTFPHLPRAPISEAVIQWKVAPSNSWTDDWLNQISERFEAYKGRTQYQVDFEWNANSEEGITGSHRNQVTGYRFTKTASGSNEFVCQFLNDSLVVSRLAPYQGWEEFSAEALKWWHLYSELIDPTEITALSTRFISQIQVENIEDAGEFTEVPKSSFFDQSAVRSLFHQERFGLENGSFELNFIQSLQPIRDGLALIVDIDVSNKGGITDFQRVDDILGKLRSIKNHVFFSIMKDPESKFGEADV